MLKKVAGGRADDRSEPGMKSVVVSTTNGSSDESEGEAAQTMAATVSAAINADERSFRKFKRGIMTSPVRNVSQRLCVDLPPQSVIGTEPAPSLLMRS